VDARGVGGVKRCGRCKLFKGPGDFHADRNTSDGYACYCRECNLAYKREHYHQTKKKSAAKSRRSRYGVTAMEFEILRNRQGTCCAICRDPLGQGKEQHLDHDHATGVVRGILCHGCNVGLGGFRDDVRRLILAAKYLRKGPAFITKDPRLFDPCEEAS
jgi:hypothetical protein